ncbi:hypothetical protein BGZ93_000162 [Podila epicladia]|nr:hypothetical protein BGZ93_000162 [Podila epicladia]KAG0088318.1 hypothetical protein BGZ92_006320 [Podila epicladia]
MPNQPPMLIKTLTDPRNTQDNERDTIINAIRVGYLGTEEIVATVNHSGGVCVWFTMRLQKDPFLLSASESAWGLAIHSEQRMIAVSTNAHLVDVFHFGIDIVKSQSSRTLAPDLSVDPSTTTLSESHQIFRGHLHNIPCVAFSPCGRFLASTSLDGTCRTWNIASGKETQHASFGDLWGWGVSFVDQGAWTTITRKEYKAIPKSHLRPGQMPGQQVRDSPMATQPFRHREQPPGRLLRMIRSRWFAGPMANTSCDESSEEDAEEPEADEDDSNGWEDAEEEDTRDNTDSEQSDSFQRPNVLLSETDDEIMSGGTNYQTDMAEETSIHNATQASRDRLEHDVNEKRFVDDSATASMHGHDQDHPQQPDHKCERNKTTVDHQQQQRLAALNHDPSRFVSFPGEASHIQESSSGKVKKAGSSSKRPNSHFPSNLLVCATARNIYLLSRYPYPEGMEKHHDVSNLPMAEPSTSSRRTAHDLVQNVSASDLQEDPDDEHGDEGQDFDDESQEDEYEDFEDGDYQVHGEESYDDEDDVDDDDELMLDLDDGEAIRQESAAYYEGENDIWLFQTENGDDDDSDSDDMEDDHDSPEAATVANAESNFTEQNPSSHRKAKKTYQHDPTEMHVLSVARAAVNRADGRGIRQLEHFDRLFYMQVVPELGVLVAASQKGCVTIFRLIRVLDDSSTAAAQERGMDQKDDKDSEMSSPISHTGSTRLCPTPANTLAVQGSNYILFPEMYLPRLEPPFSPLAGISIVPMQRKALSNQNTMSPSSTPTSSSASFILHMLYLNNVMLSYELCIKNKKDDPIGLNNLFV